LDSKTTFKHRTDAQRMADLLAIAENPTPTSAAKIDEALKADPANAAALMAHAALAEQKGDVPGAKQAYEKALARYPDFTPAKRGLAIYYSKNPGDDQKAYELAVKARESMPLDADLSKALGIIVYRRGEFPRAAGLFSESAAKRTDDAELMFYLGISQARIKNVAASKQSLQKALALGLSGENATEAKKTLAELK
jgi:Flp pilus assembly protein TadD